MFSEQILEDLETAVSVQCGEESASDLAGLLSKTKPKKVKIRGCKGKSKVVFS